MKKIIYKNITIDCIKFFLLTVMTISLIIWVLQAVNYLDFITEDGHGFFVYFNYTLLSFPKIFSRIFPFALFLSFTYILLKYENKNELLIFWNFGITKIKFINHFIKVSFFFTILSILLNSIITPISQDKARSFIRSSDLVFFENILQPKKFITIVKALTIYFDKKNQIGQMKNIHLKSESKITFAKMGELRTIKGKKFLVLSDGKTINYGDSQISEFNFTRTTFNISRFETNSTTSQKIQENSTEELLRCLIILKNIDPETELKKKEVINNCRLGSLKNINEELYLRIIKPLYSIFLIMITLLLILRSKDSYFFKQYKLKIYLITFLSIVFIELSPKFIGINFIQNLFISLLPIFFSLTLYIYFLYILKFKKNDNI